MRKPYYWESEDYTCVHPYAVYDGPCIGVFRKTDSGQSYDIGAGMHCPFCQQTFTNRQEYESARERIHADRENLLMRMFDAI